MPRSHLWGTRKGPAMVGRDQLTALVIQLREAGKLAPERWGSDVRKSVAPNLREARRIWRVFQSPRGDWLVGARVQAEVINDNPVRWTCATNGMAWKHAAAGWWRSEAEATAAFEAALREVYGDEFAAIAAAEATRNAGFAGLALYADRLNALKARAQATSWSHFSCDEWGWSTGGQRQPYTEEAIAAFEAEVTVVEQRNQERAMFVASVPPLFERLIALGVKTELDYGGNVRLIVDGRWTTPFAMTAEGLKELETYAIEQEVRRTKPVEAKTLSLTGLFGGAASVKKK